MIKGKVVDGWQGYAQPGAGDQAIALKSKTVMNGCSFYSFQINK